MNISAFAPVTISYANLFTDRPWRRRSMHYWYADFFGQLGFAPVSTESWDIGVYTTHLEAKEVHRSVRVYYWEHRDLSATLEKKDPPQVSFRVVFSTRFPIEHRTYVQATLGANALSCILLQELERV